MRTLRSRLTYANVISTLCLFIVLGGGAYAATQLPKNSVGAKQLKKNAVTGVKIKKGAIDTSKLTASAVATLKGTAGPTGPQGIQGPQGLTNGGAYATVGIDEDEKVVFVGDHPGFSAVARADNEGTEIEGVYCLTPTPGTNVGHPVASIDRGGSGGARAKFAESFADGAVLECEEGQLEVWTSELSPVEEEPGEVKWLPLRANGLAFTVFAPGTPPGA